MDNRRMIFGVVFFIVVIATFIIGYSILSWPLEYTVDNLADAYDQVTIDFVDTNPLIDNIALSLVYMFAGAFAFGILLCFVWFIAYSHKKEAEG